MVGKSVSECRPIGKGDEATGLGVERDGLASCSTGSDGCSGIETCSFLSSGRTGLAALSTTCEIWVGLGSPSL